MFKHVLLTAISVAALTVGAAAQDNPKGPNTAGAGGGAAQPSEASPNGGGANSARDVAPGQTKQQDRSARDETSGQKKESGSGANGDREKQSDASGKMDHKQDREDAKRDEEHGSKEKAANSERSGRDRDMDNKDGKNARADGNEHSKGGGKSIKNVTQEEKTKVKSVFVRHRNDAVVRDIDVSINVGVVVPRSVRLHRVPADIVSIVPAYGDYEYFIYEDKVVIVDPATYEIVDIVIIA